MKKAFTLLLILAFALAALYLFLIAPRMTGRPDMSAFDGKPIAHRGFFDNEAGVPENSLPAFQAAIDAGYSIELDVQVSKDRVAMVFHDASLERMCGVEGKIWDYTYDELRTLRLAGTQETIPTLQEVLTLVNGQTPILVEYKMDLVDTLVCEKSQAVLDGYKGAYAMQCFHPLALMWYKKNAPHVARGQLAQEYWKTEAYADSPLHIALSFLPTNVATRPDFISYHHGDAGNVSLRLCSLMGAKTAAWTLRTPEDYEQARSRFDYCIFDSFAP